MGGALFRNDPGNGSGHCVDTLSDVDAEDTG